MRGPPPVHRVPVTVSLTNRALKSCQPLFKRFLHIPKPTVAVETNPLLGRTCLVYPNTVKRSAFVEGRKASQYWHRCTSGKNCVCHLLQLAYKRDSVQPEVAIYLRSSSHKKQIPFVSEMQKHFQGKTYKIFRVRRTGTYSLKMAAQTFLVISADTFFSTQPYLPLSLMFSLPSSFFPCLFNI